MELGFILNENETSITAIKTADALIECGHFDERGLKEIIAYLSVYTKYRAGDKINGR